MTFTRILYAPNVHQGGGRTLLIPLLEALQEDDDVIFILDQRLQIPNHIHLSGVIYRVNPTPLGRLSVEWRLKSLLTTHTWLLSVNNLPPLFGHLGMQQVFIQNRYLIDPAPPLRSLPWKVGFRLKLERWWLSSRAKYVSQFVVQTPSMAKMLRQTLHASPSILPFSAPFPPLQETPPLATGHRFDFLYVASGEPHKNHRTLIEAWIELSQDGHFPTLGLTLDATRFPALCQWISSKTQAHSLKVTLLGELPQAGVIELYLASRALIYPSLYESFGLPLIEATLLGLPVLAGDLPYVKDVVRPSGMFDANSPSSIAKAVNHFTYQPCTLTTNLLSAAEFLHKTLPVPARTPLQHR